MACAPVERCWGDCPGLDDWSTMYVGCSARNDFVVYLLQPENHCGLSATSQK